MNSSLQSISNMLEDLRNRKSVSDYALADIDCDLVINKVNNVCQAFTSKSFTQVDIEANSAVDIDTLVSSMLLEERSQINLDLFERLIKMYFPMLIPMHSKVFNFQKKIELSR